MSRNTNITGYTHTHIEEAVVLRVEGEAPLRGRKSLYYVVREQGVAVGTYKALQLAVQAARLHAPDATIDGQQWDDAVRALTIIPIDFRGWEIPV